MKCRDRVDDKRKIWFIQLSFWTIEMRIMENINNLFNEILNIMLLIFSMNSNFFDVTTLR